MTLPREKRPRVTFEMNAWGESQQRRREGKPAFWSLYTFDTEAEGQKERARLEKKWRNEPGSGPYRFDLYRVEAIELPRPKPRRKRRAKQ